MSVLKQAELGLPVADLIRQIGICEQTIYHRKRQYGGVESDQIRELKQVVEENGVSRNSLWTRRCCRMCCQIVPRPAQMTEIAGVVSQAATGLRRAKLLPDGRELSS